MNSQLISNFLYLFGNAFRIYLIYQFLKVFFKVDGDRPQIVLRCTFFCLFFFINSMAFLYFQWEATVILLSNFIGVFIITLSYSGKWKYRISATVLIVALNLICEDFVYDSMLKLNISHIEVVGTAVSNLLFLMVVLLLQKVSDLRQGEDILLLEWLGIVFVPVISITISAVALDKCENELSITVGEIGLLALNVFVFYLFDHLVNMYRNQSQLMALEAQNQAYEKQLGILNQSEEKISALRHDMKNHIITLQQMSKQTDNEELQKYMGDMLTFTQPEELFVSTGDSLTDGLINLKLSEAVKVTGAEVDCEVQIQENCVINKMDLSIVLGNLLDNAIQAMGKCKGKRQLKFFMEGRRGLLLIRIKNSYAEKIKEKEGTFLSTKKNKENHGVGLKNVKRIAEKYEGEFRIDYTEDWFSVELLLFPEPTN